MLIFIEGIVFKKGHHLAHMLSRNFHGGILHNKEVRMNNDSYFYNLICKYNIEINI